MNLGFNVLLNVLIKMLVPVIGGYGMSRAKILPEDYPSKLSHLVLYVCQPFLLVSSVLGVEHTKENMLSGLTVLLLGFVCHGLLALIAFLLTKPFKDKHTGRMLEHCMLFGNVGFFGIPVIREVFGEIGAFYAGFFIVSFNIVLWSYGMFVLSRSGKSMSISVKKIFLNAGTIPCTLGLIIFFTGIKIYAPVLDGMRMVGDSCTPLSMIIVGSMIARIPLKRLIFKWQPYFVCLAKLVIAPVVIGAVLKLIGFSDTFSLFGALMMAFPTASSSAMFAEKYELQPELAAQSVGLTTVISVITVPLIMQAVKFVVNLL